MIDTRPIGVFDSGLGGLTTIKELEKLLPNEDIIYFGDTARIPYGTRSFETIIKYAKQDFDFLMSHNVKAVVIACGTVSTVAFETLKNYCSDVPIIDVVTPAVKKACEVTQNGKIGLIATQASVSSGMYDKELHKMLDTAKLYSNACPLLVPIVESGRIARGDKLACLIVEEYLTDIKNMGVDTLILGCTHYPLLSDIIFDFMPVNLVNSGLQAAVATSNTISPNSSVHNGRTDFYVSDSVQGFSSLASLLLGRNIENVVKKVDLESILG